MSTQMRVNKLADVAALAATTNYVFKADYHRVWSVQAVWTAASSSSTITLQLSNDNATWDNFTSATSITAAGNVSWYLDAKDAMYVRALITYTSGAIDTLKIYVAYVGR